jgi:hypothetical protein
MFVLEAVTLTFLTTPLVSALYPPQLRVRVSSTGETLVNVAGTEGAASDTKLREGDNDGLPQKTRFTVVLDKIEHLPGMMALTQLIQPTLPKDVHDIKTGSGKTLPDPKNTPDIFIDALRLIELSDRTSAVMKSSAADALLHTDPLLGIFRMFGELHDLDISTSLSIVLYDDLAHSVTDHATNNASQLILLPWIPPSAPTHDPNETSAVTPRAAAYTSNPFDALFGSRTDKTASTIHSHFVRGVFSQSKTDVALFIDRGHAPGQARTAGSAQHIFLPFIGGPDDRLALDFVVQLCAKAKITATVLRIMKREVNPRFEKPEAAHFDSQAADEVAANIQDHGLTITSVRYISYFFMNSSRLTRLFQISGFPDTVYGQATTQTRLQSETADNVMWSRYALHSTEEPATPLTDALSRIKFLEVATPVPLHAAVQSASSQLESLAERRSLRLLIVAGRSRRLAVENHQQELKMLMEEHGIVGNEVRKTVGDVATAFVVAGCKAGIVVIQAANVPLD